MYKYITKNYIHQFINKLLNYKLKNEIPKIILGRWSIEIDNNKTNIKVDNANEDHCGSCFYSKKLYK